VDEIIPTIEHRLTVSNEKHRRDAAKIIAYVTSSPNNDFIQRYKTLWNTFLEQYVNHVFVYYIITRDYLDLKMVHQKFN
jgi:hypothetical protein